MGSLSAASRDPRNAASAASSSPAATQALPSPFRAAAVHSRCPSRLAIASEVSALLRASSLRPSAARA